MLVVIVSGAIGIAAVTLVIVISMFFRGDLLSGKLKFVLIAFSVATFLCSVSISGRAVIESSMILSLVLTMIFAVFGILSASIDSRLRIPLWIILCGALPVCILGALSLSFGPIFDGFIVCLPFGLTALLYRSTGVMIKETAMSFVIGSSFGLGLGLLLATAGSAVTLFAFRKEGAAVASLPFLPCMSAVAMLGIFGSTFVH